MVYLMDIPKEMIYLFDKKHLGEQIADEFLLNIEEYVLDICRDYRHSDFEIKFREIPHSGKRTNDWLTYLILNNEQEHIIASVLCTQTKLNKYNYAFFRDLDFLKEIIL